MIKVDHFQNQKVAIVGLGISGISAARALKAGGAEIVAWDDSEEGRKNAEKEGLPVAPLKDADWSEFKALILAPGIPLHHPKPHWSVEMAQAAGVDIIGDTELFFLAHRQRKSKAKIVGVTGTNGKSTTVSLITHCLKSAGRNVELGGNIGTAVLDLEPLKSDGVYVLELSSFQIDLTPSLDPDIAVLLNITPDHLDRHGSLEDYAKTKAQVFSHGKKGSLAVIGADDDLCHDIAARLSPTFEKCLISGYKSLENGVSANKGKVIDSRQGQVSAEIDLENVLSLRGQHNGQNAAACYAVCRHLGLTAAEIEKGMRDFPGLSHRMELVGELRNILFINDSKATNAEATSNALASFENIYWIAGGRAKAGGIESLKSYFPKIRKAFFIGEAADDFADTVSGKVPYKICHTLQKALTAAVLDATRLEANHSKSAELVILFSPAAASYDQFPNFVIRGETFAKEVAALRGVSLKKDVAA